MNGETEPIFEKRPKHQRLRWDASNRRRRDIRRRSCDNLETICRHPVRSADKLEPLNLVGESNQLQQRLVARREGPAAHPLDKAPGFRGLVGLYRRHLEGLSRWILDL